LESSQEEGRIKILTDCLKSAYHRKNPAQSKEDRRMKITGMLILAVFVFFGNCPVWADATVESSIKSSGFKGMGAFEGTSSRKYQGEKMWDSTSSRFTGAILSRVTGGSETATITRVDKGVYWTLDPKNKTYAERPIEAIKMGEPGKEKPEQEKSKVRVTKSEFSVKKTGASETINGFPCEEYLVTWLLEMEDMETKAKSRSTMTNNLWTTPETATIRKVQAEERAFHKAYAQKLGIQMSPEEAKQMGIEAFTAMSGASKEEIEKGFMKVREEMAKIKGYPIRTVVNWSVEGDKIEGAEKEEKASSESSSQTPTSVGGFLSGLSKGITQKVMKDKGSTSGQKEGATFSTTHEIKAIHADSVPAEVFEVPPGYSKK
jgi:hypothetical protein